MIWMMMELSTTYNYLLAPLTDGYMELRPSEMVYLTLAGCFPNID
jgi:hypothetical protein